MKIDFTATHELNQVIGFVNDKGETVRTYELTELEDYVLSNHLNSEFVEELVSGSGMPSDPNNVFKEVEVITPLTEYLDENWCSVCEMFYKHKNPHEFKSFNREQETRKAVGI